MAEGQYQVIFSGRIIDGAELDMVKGNVARLFKLAPEQVDKLFCGRRLILKKQLDQATAEKYQSTMLRAGAICEVQNMSSGQAPARAETAIPAAGPVTPQTAPSSTISIAEPGVQLVEQQVVPEANIDIGSMDMAEPGVQLVEQQVVPEANIDIGSMDMAEPGVQLAEHVVVPEADIDIGGIDMAEAGITLVEPSQTPPVNIDTNSMSMDAPGVRLVEGEEVPPAQIDTSHLSVN